MDNKIGKFKKIQNKLIISCLIRTEYSNLSHQNELALNVSYQCLGKNVKRLHIFDHEYFQVEK